MVVISLFALCAMELPVVEWTPRRYNHLTMRGRTLFTFRSHANDIKVVLF